MHKKIISLILVLFISGVAGRLYAAHVSYVGPDGILHDSIWLLIGSLLALLAIGIALVYGVYLVFSLVKWGWAER